MPVGPASSPSGVFLLSEAFSFEKAPEQVPSELPKVSETFLICPLMLGPNITGKVTYGHNGMIGRKGSAEGAFGKIACSESDASSGKETASDLDFSGSRSSNIFGSSITVQPTSVRLYPCIKS